MIYLLNCVLAVGMFDVVAFVVAAAVVAGTDEAVVGAVSSEDQFVGQVKEHDVLMRWIV